MARAYTPKVLTANRLLEGDAVWRTASGDWSPRIAEAEVIHDEPTANLRLFETDAEAHLVVGVYLAEVQDGAAGPQPRQFREAVRTRGPSNYSHGKQEA